MTGILGCGFAPMGVSFYGYGLPAVAASQQGSPLEESPNGVVGDARLIDQQTRDYDLDIYGQTTGTSSVSQQVFLALMTTKGSSANFSLGNQLWNIKTINLSSIQAQATNYVNAALSTLIQSKTISLQSVSVSTSQNNICVNLTVNWTDLTSGTSQTTGFPIG